jgi:diguanylate cyclase (GGDEF)-like protein
MIGQGCALLLALGLVVLTAPDAHWDIGRLLVIAVFTVISDLTAVETASAKLKVSASFLGLMLAAVLLGAAPAALIGVLSIGVSWFRWREAPHYLLNNLLTFAWFPLLSGLFFHAAVRLADASPKGLGYYLFVFAAFVLALALNFLGVAGYQSHLDRSSLMEKVREALVPILASELFSAVLTMLAVYVAVALGTVGLALFGLVLVIFQYLVGELLVSQQRSEDLKRMATTDELTGLPNREFFRERLDEKIAAAGQAGDPFSVMLLGLDRFKDINDTLGHHYGDLLLRDLGPRLKRAVGDHGLVARFGGDEFGVLLAQRTHDPEVVEELVAALLGGLREPFLVDELSLELSASVGVSRFPLDGDDANTLLRCADVAMYAAKDAHSECKFYSAEHDPNSMQRLSVLSDMRNALKSEEIVVHFQPIVDLDNLRVRGAEGLVRWQHPEHGLLPPGAFIQTVEQTSLIGPLTRHVLEQSISRCAEWRKADEHMTVSVNLSVRNLMDRNLPDEIERMLFTYGLPPDALQLEITESMIMSDPERALAIVGRLSALGIRLSVDDFGTGYSSLANLRRLPIDELKIDRSFVSPMLQDESDLIIVRSTINMGHDLGLKIIAEGVEDESTLNHLADLGCDLAQGYHLSRPLPPDAFSEWLALGPRQPTSGATA